MRALVILSLLGISSLANAQQPMDGMRQMIVTGAISTGKTYEVAKLCGASKEDLEGYKARFDADAYEGRASFYPSLGIDIDKTFDMGIEEGRIFYAKLTTNRDHVCSETLALIARQSSR